MLCPYCIKGLVYKGFTVDSEDYEFLVPCETCNGCGIISCCDGMCETGGTSEPVQRTKE